MVTVSFDDWFASNYESLKADLLPTNLFGELYRLTSEDVFHNAYLLARELVNGTSENEYYTIFLASFRRENKRHWDRFNHSKEIKPNDLFWALLKVEESEDNNDLKEKKDKLFADIIKWCRKNFSADEFDVFKMYFANGFSQYDIADYYGTCVRAINKRLGHMKAMLCARFEGDYINLL